MEGWIDENLLSTFAVVSPLESTYRMCGAMLLAGIIGFERERSQKPAGLRSHILVALAACLFVIVSQQLGGLRFGGNSEIRVDPLRLIEAVTAGVAFLAGGVIFTSGGRVRNIVTGTSLWLSGAIGLACGSGQVPVAAIATGLVVAVVIVLREFERWMSTHEEDPEDNGSPQNEVSGGNGARPR